MAFHGEGRVGGALSNTIRVVANVTENQMGFWKIKEDKVSVYLPFCLSFTQRFTPLGLSAPIGHFPEH